MFLCGTKRNHFLISGKRWIISKTIKKSFFTDFIKKKKKCIRQLPPFRYPVIRINHIWSFFFKIKGFLAQLNISKEAEFNKVNFSSIIKNVFGINSMEIQRKLELISFKKKENFFINIFIKSREFFIFKEPPFFSGYFWNLNSGLVCVPKSQYNNKNVYSETRGKIVILSTW